MSAKLTDADRAAYAKLFRKHAADCREVAKKVRGVKRQIGAEAEAATWQQAAALMSMRLMVEADEETP